MEQLLTIKETAHYLNIHWQTVQKYIKEGKLKSHKVGRNIRISSSDLDRFVDITTTSKVITEIERKFIITPKQRRRIEKKLVDTGAKVSFHAHLIDHYFIPNKIMSSDEQASWFKGNEGFGLRIRETDNDYSGNITTTMVAKKLTQASDHGIHEELELDAEDYVQMKRFFELIGMKENVVVDKDRVVYSYLDFKICIDEIKSAGIGVEIEYRGQKGESEAVEAIMEMGYSIGLSDKELSTKGISFLPFERAVY